jgi:hypothetical protein
MNEHFNLNLLTHQLIRSVDRAVRYSHITSSDLMTSSCSLLAHVSNIVSEKASTLDQLNSEEQRILTLVRHTVKNIFDSKRQSLIDGLPFNDQSFTKHQILESTKQMLLNDELTHHEGLQLVGDLVSAITYFQSPTIESLQEVKDLETETMSHIREKLNRALEAIQVQQGFVTKQ